MGCQSCIYLIEDNKKEGKVDGAVYYCSKLKKYVNGATDECDKYKKCYGRTSYIKNQIYNDGKRYYNDETPVSFYAIALVFICITGFILKLLNI